MKRVLPWLLLSLAALLTALLCLAGFGFYRVYYGKHVYETVAPELPADLNKPAILIFSKTNGFREDAAVKAANSALSALMKSHGWVPYVTENGAVFNAAELSRFNATVWNNTSGDTLNDEQKAAFQNYIQNGGGFVGIHGAGGDTHYAWGWYVETLIGAQFKGHPLNPQFQQATIHIEDRNDPATRELPEPWIRTDEWYSFEKSPRGQPGFQILATLDERTYHPKMLWKDINMGTDHPVVWKHMVGKGRVFYSALGHSANTYQEPLYLALLDGAVAWAGGFDGESSK
jgi:type 1 glutamine amidotransferase